MTSPASVAGTRYKTDDAVLLLQQAPGGAPVENELFDTVSNPLIPPLNSAAQLAHFFDGIYDLRPESHLSRLLKTILGDACFGMIQKQYLQARMSEVLLTTHFTDLDRLYGDIFGLTRLASEALPFNPYSDQATPEAWAEIHGRDAAYRSRIEQFSRAINMGATALGMEAAAEAMLGVDVQIYETWAFVDEAETSPGGLNAANIGANLYQTLEGRLLADLERQSYADLEGGVGSYGRTTSSNRSEFVVRPMREISLEEHFQLTKVLTRLKPAEALLTIDSNGAALHRLIGLRNVWADSIYWEVKTTVSTTAAKAPTYVEPKSVQKDPLTLIIERIIEFFHPKAIPAARPAFTAYQGEKFAYNSDVVSVTSFSESIDGTISSSGNWARDVQENGKTMERAPSNAMATAHEILMGRLSADGIMVSSPFAADRSGGTVITSSQREGRGTMGGTIG